MKKKRERLYVKINGHCMDCGEGKILHIAKSNMKYQRCYRVFMSKSCKVCGNPRYICKIPTTSLLDAMISLMSTQNNGAQ